MSDVMLFGVLRMPYHMAMGDEMSRIQFYDRVQEALDRMQRAEAAVGRANRAYDLLVVASAGGHIPQPTLSAINSAIELLGGTYAVEGGGREPNLTRGGAAVPDGERQAETTPAQRGNAPKKAMPETTIFSGHLLDELAHRNVVVPSVLPPMSEE